MATTYSITEWDSHFEVSQTRKVEMIRWVPVPVKHDGLGFRRVLSLEDGLAVFGAWILLLQVAGKCKTRGLLTTNTGRPLTAQDIAIKTGAPEKAIERALQVLSSKDIGWIEATTSSEVESSSSDLVLQERTGQERTGQIAASAAFGELPQTAGTPTPSPFSFPVTGKGPAEWTLPQAKLDEYLAAYPALDVPAELTKARQWCRDSPRRRKTAGGMLAFLTGWLNRAQNGSARVPETKDRSWLSNRR